MQDQDRDKSELLAELAELRVRLEEAEETLRAIQAGEVDAVVVSGPKGEQVYALSESLQEHMHFLQTLLEAIPNPVFYKDVGTVFQGCNQAYADLLGLSKAGIVGKTVFDLFPPELAESYHQKDLELQQQGGVQVFETPFVRSDGSSFEALVYKATYTNMDGKLAGNIGVLLDITARKQAEEALREREEWLLLAQQVANIGIFEWNIQTGINTWTPELEALHGLPPGGFAGTQHAWENLVHPDDRTEAFRQVERSFAVDGAVEGEWRVVWPDGSVHWLAGRWQAFKDESGKPLRLTGVNIDITANKQAEEDLQRAKDELEDRVAARTMELQQANGLLTARTHDLEERHRETTLLSQMSEVLQNCRTMAEAHKAIAKFLRQLFPADSGALFIFGASRRVLEAVAAWGEKPNGDEVIDPDDCWALRLGRMHLAAESKADLRCPHVADDSRVSLCVPLMGQGEALGMLHLLIQAPTAPQLEAKQQLALSVGDRVGLGLANLRLQETLRNLSVRDPLTGLFNRRYLEETLEREFVRATRQGTALAFIMLDIDHFKRFNDTYGHDAGDALLRELGVFLQRYCRGSDVACRYGGEEFVLTLPECSLEIACRRAEEMRQAVKNLQVHNGHRTLEAITLSFGVAAFPEHGDNRDAVLNAADAAMYQAKEAGRDRVVAAGGDSA